MSTCPCDNCIALAMCINKNWGKIIIHCDMIANYILDESDIRNCKKGTEKLFLIKSLNKMFDVSKNINGKIYFGRGKLPTSFIDAVAREKGW